ncbi:MAG: hypothetical protein AB1758_34640, partial [Candidatus Eremiobacterota bacterium]
PDGPPSDITQPIPFDLNIAPPEGFQASKTSTGMVLENGARKIKLAKYPPPRPEEMSHELPAQMSTLAERDGWSAVSSQDPLKMELRDGNRKGRLLGLQGHGQDGRPFILVALLESSGPSANRDLNDMEQWFLGLANR